MPSTEGREPYERRVDDVLERFQLRLEAYFATKAEMAAVTTAQIKQDLELAKLQSELQHMNVTLGQISANIRNVTWVIVVGVITAVLGTVLI